MTSLVLCWCVIAPWPSSPCTVILQRASLEFGLLIAWWSEESSYTFNIGTGFSKIGKATRPVKGYAQSWLQHHFLQILFIRAVRGPAQIQEVASTSWLSWRTRTCCRRAHGVGRYFVSIFGKIICHSRIKESIYICQEEWHFLALNLQDDLCGISSKRTVIAHWLKQTMSSRASLKKTHKQLRIL